VGASERSIPTRLTPSQQVGGNLHVQAQQWEYGAGGDEHAGRVIEPRNDYSCGHQDNPQDGQEARADGFQWPEATVSGSRRQESGTPPGSKSGACRHRGNSGTWESHLSPCVYSRSGGPGDQKPWRGRGASTRPRALAGHHEQIEAGKVLGSERQAKRPGTGSVAVLAEHSTWEGGEVWPKRPTGGKATPGLTRS
jgi:hypothetical protein